MPRSLGLVAVETDERLNEPLFLRAAQVQGALAPGCRQRHAQLRVPKRPADRKGAPAACIHEAALDDVPQLAQVPGPGVATEELQRLGRDAV